MFYMLAPYLRNIHRIHDFSSHKVNSDKPAVTALLLGIVEPIFFFFWVYL